MEKLLVQIFERKKWIVNQAKQQTFLFEQHLVSKCLIEGIPPPPWLCSSSDPNNVLNKQELNSRVPLPRALPAIPFSSSHCSVYDKRAPTTLSGELPNGLCTELHGLDKGFGAGYEVSVLPQCSVCDAVRVSNGVPQDVREEDPSVTSPEDVRDARISDIYHDPALSPPRGARDGVSILPQCPVSNAGCSFNSVPQDQRKEDLTNTSPEDHGDARTSDIYHDPALSLARVQRSKSRQKALEIRNSAKKCFSQDKNNGSGYASGTIGFAISSLQADHVDELNLVKPSDTSDYACEVEEAKIGEFRSKERCTTTSSGRITRSRSSSQQESSLNVSGSVCIDRKSGGALADYFGISPQQSNHVNKPLELVNSSQITNDSRQENEAKGDHFSKEKGSSMYSGRTTRSRSASQEPNCLDELSKLEHSSNSISEGGARNSLQQPKHVDEMVEVVKSCDVIDATCEVKTKVGECWSKGTNDYSGRITRSGSSSRHPNDDTSYPKVDASCVSLKGDFNDAHGSQVSILRSLPAQNNLEFCAVNGEKHSRKEDSSAEYVSTTRSTGSQAVRRTEKIAKDAIANISSQRINQSTCAASNKSHEAQRTQISAGRSVPIQCDLDLRAEISTDSSDNENDADHYAGRKTSAETNCTTEGMSKPVNSQALGHRGTRSRSAASSKHLSGKMTRGSAGIKHQDVSSTLVKEVPCTQTSEFVKAATGGETEIDHDLSVEGSRSKLDGTGLRVGVEVLASRQPADCNVFVNPKQLSFDDGEESCRNGCYTPVFKEEMQGRATEKRSLPLMHPEDIRDEGMTVDYQENRNSSLPMNCPGDLEASVKEKDLQSGFSESPAEESRSVSNGNAVSSVKEASDAHNDAGTNTLLESGNRESLCGNTGSVQHSPKAFLESQGLSLSRENVVKSILSRSPVEEMPQSEDHDMIESSESSPKAQIKEGETSDEMNVVKPPDASSCEVEEAEIGEFQSKERGTAISSSRITRSRSSGHQESSLNVSGSATNARKTGSTLAGSPGISPRLSNHANQHLKSINYYHITNESCRKKEAKERDHFLMEGSCPQHKRRMIEHKTVDDLSASLDLREHCFYTVNRHSMCGNLGSVEHSPKAVLESQSLSISQEEVVKSIVSRSSVAETHQNEDHHMIEWSEPKAQMIEGRISLGCGNTSGNAPFTFMDNEFEESILSLMKQTGGQSQNCLMEEKGVAHPPSIIVDSGSQSIEGSTVSLTLEDNLTIGNAERMTCAGREMQEMRFNLEGTSNFGSPQGQSLDLIGSDDTKPELERFVMQTDDEPTSIAGKGNSFDEWNLPSTTIEHASILEQLCQSACMQTPIACSSASYKLHNIPNLYQSVPTGLLEGVDTRAMNDAVKQLKDGLSCSSEEVGQAFYGRSYSDCLLNHSGQSGWDTKKPYLSPVGKLWDITGSRTSSSRKRESLNPELPCISEENENADEVADTFQDGIVSDALNSSIQRIPLADIAEIPNPHASVPKAEPYADRLSLDSVNTEFSFTGTHKSFEQKLGIQNSSKRRYNKKENLSMSQGTNDIKRTTGSLHNRFSKPKLSGKTSLRKGGPSLSEQEPKRNNIVSSMTSFIPLVQQKQAAAVVIGKRDVKVKALEAAEAAKRLAEKKENERKMKKQALKLERSRMEQENMKQLELQKKMKEEERKKKEADMASKKRQREEEERKEKERKRMRVEARRQQRGHGDKLPAEKVEKKMKSQAIDGRGPGGKKSKDEKENKKMEEERGFYDSRNILETEPSTSGISISNAGRESIVREEFHEASSNYGHKAEVPSNLDREMDNSIGVTSQEQSYDISPYKESDDENDDDNNVIPNNKFIPSWSSKNCLAFAISCQNRADPETIFHPERFCCISEVLLPRKHQLNNSGMS